MDIPFLDAAFIESHTNFSALTGQLCDAFAQTETIIPDRHHHDFSTGETTPPNTLLLMPAWNPNESAGVKIVTVHPGNSAHHLPSIQGIYVHLNAQTGQVQCILDAKSLTAKRTAAASALASKFLSREDTDSILMIGTGTLCENLIRAHAAVRPITQAYIWGRDHSKAQQAAERFLDDPIDVEPVQELNSVMSKVDIVSCATLSPLPLVHGQWLREGQHIDLVGAYRPTMREADDDVIRRGKIFLDTMNAGLRESGDIAIPIQEKLITPGDIQADLFGLCSGIHSGRQSESEITVFKSVGYALEDLVGANYYFDQWSENIA